VRLLAARLELRRLVSHQIQQYFSISSELKVQGGPNVSCPSTSQLLNFGEERGTGWLLVHRYQ
jgi:hypothetical protein